MKTLFFGTSSFAVPSLRVVAARTDLRGVVTQPDRPAGRGHKLTPSPVKVVAAELGIAVYEPERLRDFTARLEPGDFDLFALASYGKILPRQLLEVPRLGALNVHPSLLPKYRGATPIQNALRNGDTETGVSIMLMDAGMDTGPLVVVERVAIAPGENYGELHDRLALAGADALARTIERIVRDGRVEATPQSGEPSVTKPISKKDLEIDWGWDPQRIVAHVRAFSPQPGARATIDGENVKVLRAHVADGEVEIDELIAPNRGKMSGTAYTRSRAARP